jgi:O-antigen ligase
MTKYANLRNINFIFLLLTVIAISLEKRAVPYLILAFSLTLVTQKSALQRLKLLKNPFTIFSVLFYVLLVVGYVYSENQKAALFDLEVKFSLFLFPILLPLIELDRKQFEKVLLAFVGGCFIAFLICLSMATLYFYSSLDPAVFYYNRLSVFHHPTYFSMYLNFAVIIIYYFLIYGGDAFYVRSKVALIAMIIVFSIFVVMLSSKMGLITLLVIIFGGTILWFLRSRAVFPSILVFLMVSSLIYISFRYSTTIQDRINEAVKSISEENYSFSTTSARIAIWEVSTDLLKASPVIGYGTGDVKDELMKEYEKRGYSFLHYKKLNAHNQYLQAAIGLGFIGLLVFLVSILFPLKEIIRGRNMLYAGFLFLVTFNFFTESALETQAGVVFYAIFNALLYFNRHHVSFVGPLEEH